MCLNNFSVYFIFIFQKRSGLESTDARKCNKLKSIHHKKHLSTSLLCFLHELVLFILLHACFDYHQIQTGNAEKTLETKFCTRKNSLFSVVNTAGVCACVCSGTQRVFLFVWSGSCLYEGGCCVWRCLRCSGGAALNSFLTACVCAGIGKQHTPFYAAGVHSTDVCSYQKQNYFYTACQVYYLLN